MCLNTPQGHGPGAWGCPRLSAMILTGGGPVERASGREELFRELFHGLYVRMFNLALSLSGDPHSAQDVTQEAFARLWEAMREQRSIRNPAAWLACVIGNLVARTVKAKRRVLSVDSTVIDAVLASEQADPETLQIHQAETRWVREEILHLPPRQRQLVTLKYYLEMATGEMAKHLGLSEVTVRAHLRKAIIRLLARYMSENSDPGADSPTPCITIGPQEKGGKT